MWICNPFKKEKKKKIRTIGFVKLIPNLKINYLSEIQEVIHIFINQIFYYISTVISKYLQIYKTFPFLGSAMTHWLHHIIKIVCCHTLMTIFV